MHRVPWASCIPSAALGEPQLCYILDAILFLYGIVLTLLYCRLKVRWGGTVEEPDPGVGGLRKGNRRGSPWFGGEGDGPPTSPLLIAFPPLQIQVRKAAIASYEVWSPAPVRQCVCFQALSLPGLLALVLRPLGRCVFWRLICTLPLTSA